MQLGEKISKMTPLRQRMLEDTQIRRLSPHTQRMYLAAVARFAQHFGRSPAHLGPEHIRAYQLHLVARGTGHAIFTIAVSALRFLYTVTLHKEWRIDAIPHARKSHAFPTPPPTPVRSRVLPPDDLRERNLAWKLSRSNSISITRAPLPI